VLVVDNGENKNLALGLRNLQGVTLMPTKDVNAYHLLGHQSVLLSAAAAQKFSEALSK
jgi:large subunit ribosomal protein L4